MSNITALSNADAPEASRPLLEAVEKKLGKAPNLLRTLAHAPAALQSYLSLSEVLGGGLFDGKEREMVALAVGEANDCDYCLAAHTMIGGMQGLGAAEIENARRGRSDDPKQSALVALAHEIVGSRGRPSEDQVHSFLGAGWTEGHLMELVSLVAFNTLTNYTNHIANTDVDFPAAPALT